MATWPWAKVSLGCRLHCPWLMHFHKPRSPHHHPPQCEHIHSILKVFCHFRSIEFVNCQITESCHPFPPQKSSFWFCLWGKAKINTLSLTFRSSGKIRGHPLTLCRADPENIPFWIFCLSILFSPRVCLQNILWNWQSYLHIFALQSA